MADNQWQELMRDWQSTDMESQEQKTAQLDVKALEQKTRRKARNMSLFMWLDILAGILFVGFFIYLILTDDLNTYQLTVFTGVSFIIIPMVIYSVWVRRGLWQANGSDTHAYLELTRDRAMAGMRLAKANINVAYLVFPFIIAVLIWRMFTTEVELNWPFNILVFVTLIQLAIFATIYFGSRHYYRVKEKEFEQSKKLLSELTEPE